MISAPSKARLGYMCPVEGLDNRDPRPGEIARVGGHRRQPVLNINKTSQMPPRNKSFCRMRRPGRLLPVPATTACAACVQCVLWELHDNKYQRSKE